MGKEIQSFQFIFTGQQYFALNFGALFLKIEMQNHMK